MHTKRLAERNGRKRNEETVQGKKKKLPARIDDFVYLCYGFRPLRCYQFDLHSAPADYEAL